MVGIVDGQRRPLLRLQMRDGGQLLALIDTGFNGQLWMARADATGGAASPQILHSLN